MELIGSLSNMSYINSRQVTVLVTYDFAVDGGVAGTITLAGAPTIPDNAVCWVKSYDVLTTFTSSTDTATIKLTIPTDGDLFPALAIDDANNPWDAGVFGANATTNNGALASWDPIKTTAARVPVLTVATQNLTAGKAIFAITYFLSI